MRDHKWLAIGALVTALLFVAGCGDSAPEADSQATTPTVGATAPGGTWAKLAPLPTPRSEVAVAEVGGFIYVAGGFEANGAPSQKVEVYDPREDIWSEAPPLPEPRHHATAAAWEGDLLVIGGFLGGFDDPRSTVYRYDPESRDWSENPPLEVARGAGASAIVQGNPVVVGGIGEDGKSLASAEWLDGSGALWNPFDSDMPTVRDHLAAATVTVAYGDVLYDRLYAIGGRQNGDFSRNLTANEWSQGFRDWSAAPPLPTARSGIAAVAYQYSEAAFLLPRRVYVFGGEGPDGTFATNEFYDLETDIWVAAEPMPTARHGLGAVFFEGVIYVIGGGPTPGLSATGTNEAYTPDAYEPPDEFWSRGRTKR